MSPIIAEIKRAAATAFYKAAATPANAHKNPYLDRLSAKTPPANAHKNPYLDRLFAAKRNGTPLPPEAPAKKPVKSKGVVMPDNAHKNPYLDRLFAAKSAAQGGNPLGPGFDPVKDFQVNGKEPPAPINIPSPTPKPPVPTAKPKKKWAPLDPATKKEYKQIARDNSAAVKRQGNVRTVHGSEADYARRGKPIHGRDASVYGNH
jgi:hypothetical protein